MHYVYVLYVHCTVQYAYNIGRTIQRIEPVGIRNGDGGAGAFDCSFMVAPESAADELPDERFVARISFAIDFRVASPKSPIFTVQLCSSAKNMSIQDTHSIP